MCWNLFFNDQHDLTKIKEIHNDGNYAWMLKRTIHIETKDKEKLVLDPTNDPSPIYIGKFIVT